MKNKRGFTLVELLAVVTLLAIVLVITIPLFSNSGKNGKVQILKTKVENIKKAAIVFAQENKVKFTTSSCSRYANNPCSSVSVGSCECANLPITLDLDEDGNPEIDTETLSVADLVTAGTLEPDDKNTVTIKNSVSDANLNFCTITLYKKYGKIYAIYDKEGYNDAECWYE